VTTNQKTHSIKDLRHLTREIALWRSMRHPNIVLFIGASYSDNTGIQIVMEDMKGGDLQTRMEHAEGSGLGVKTTLEIALAIAKALAWMHGNKPPILHRDLKPANVLFDKHGEAKVADFGLSRLNLLKREMTGMTGTLRYMAPENVRCEHYDSKVDIYSFGLIVFFMLVGKPPFSANDRDSRMAFADDSKNFIVSHRIRPDIKALIQLCTRADPCERPSALECLPRLKSMQQIEACCSLS